MTTRVDSLPENSLVDRVTSLQSELQELRGAAQTFGAASYRPHRVFSANPVDLTVTTVKYNNIRIEVTFTPTDTSLSGLGGVLFMRAVMTDASGRVITPVMTERLVPVNGISKWRLYPTASDTFPAPSVTFKFYFFSTCAGTFSTALF